MADAIQVSPDENEPDLITGFMRRLGVPVTRRASFCAGGNKAEPCRTTTARHEEGAAHREGRGSCDIPG
jgi:hypothetical protein